MERLIAFAEMIDRNAWRFGKVDFINVRDRDTIQSSLKGIHFEKIKIKFKQINKGKQPAANGYVKPIKDVNEFSIIKRS